MNFNVLKQVVDSAGNVGFQYESTFSGTAAEALAFIANLTAVDGVLRQVDCSISGGTLALGNT